MTRTGKQQHRVSLYSLYSGPTSPSQHFHARPTSNLRTPDGQKLKSLEKRSVKQRRKQMKRLRRKLALARPGFF